MRFVAALVVAGGLASLTSATPAWDGSVFLDMCTSGEVALSNACTGQAMGAFSALDFVNNAPDGYGLPQRFCVPRGVDIVQWQDMLVQYVERHAEKRHLAIGALAYMLLVEEFPCQ